MNIVSQPNAYAGNPRAHAVVALAGLDSFVNVEVERARNQKESPVQPESIPHVARTTTATVRAAREEA